MVDTVDVRARKSEGSKRRKGDGKRRGGRVGMAEACVAIGKRAEVGGTWVCGSGYERSEDEKMQGEGSGSEGWVREACDQWKQER